MCKDYELFAHIENSQYDFHDPYHFVISTIVAHTTREHEKL